MRPRIVMLLAALTAPSVMMLVPSPAWQWIVVEFAGPGAEGAVLMERAGCDGNTLLLAALMRRGQDVNTPGSNRTPLSCAAMYGHARTVEMLLKRGALVNARDPGDSTALILAAGTGHLAIVRRLLAAGADVDAKDGRGLTAASAASRRKHFDIVEAIQNHRR